MSELNKLALIGLLIAMLFAGIVVGSIIREYVLPTTGTIVLEFELTAEPSAIDWGNVTLNTTVMRSVNLTNTGTSPIANLTASYGNETGALIGATYTVSWDAEDYPLPTGQSLMANFTLTVTDATDGAFTFKIWIEDKG